ncbi:MAG: hypothetical protein A2270_00765 [Elusimicrobia bacterium RIFOXYA12_FULL_51_18]|nr:MAG: hypothetical protein A2270_00765 [Elusimicrobia bacterium RIFOXYA12_FULL_51_18]OGS29029.1 MAG: hypothetical protein A2218_08780 [Elusimicrobia bacterium RIFOXYA2_FULL_53_38]
MDKPAQFISGIKLSRLFYKKTVAPILHIRFPRLNYSAGLLGAGSEVLGYDTPVSRDHDWGPKVFIFLSKTSHNEIKEKIAKVLSTNLPHSFLGYPTNFSAPDSKGVRTPLNITSGPVNHRVAILTTKSFIETRLKVDPFQKISVSDWLAFPQQRLLEIVRGEVFYDGLRELRRIRKKFRFYPRDVWLYMLAAQWIRISQEEAFVGRCGDVGDELGSRIVAARIIRDLMRLCFLLEREYAPYSKWLGTAFLALKPSKSLIPVFNKILSAETWRKREKHLSEAYAIVAKLCNSKHIIHPLPHKVSLFHERPYRVIHAVKFAEAFKSKIQSKAIKAIKTNAGAIDQFIDSTDVLSYPDTAEKIRIWDR